MSIFVALIIFLLVVLFHEAGHFTVAKKVGIRVNEFSVGMGPSLWHRQKGETLYSLRAIPLGGYCAMEGEDDESEDPRSFDRAKPGKRFLTILAGPVMNLLIAYVCLALFLGIRGVPQPVVEAFTDNSALQEAGLQEGDRILAIDGQTTVSAQAIRDAVQKSEGKALELRYQRQGQEDKTVSVTPKKQGDQYLLGFQFAQTKDFLSVVTAAFTTGLTLLGQLFQIIFRLLTGGLPLDAVSGPIGVVTVIGKAAKKGVTDLIFLTGYISLNLAFFNLLPIPGLDGSKLLFIVIEKLRGKPMKKSTEEKITLAGMVFLLGLIAIVSVKDVLRLF